MTESNTEHRSCIFFWSKNKNRSRATSKSADENMDEEEVPTASLGVWVGLIVLTAVSFWSQATVTEER